jgi:hypothetical protein
MVSQGGNLQGWNAAFYLDAQSTLAGPVVDHRSSSHPARCGDPAAGERPIDATRKGAISLVVDIPSLLCLMDEEYERGGS